MTTEWLSRTVQFLGSEQVKKLQAAHVLIVGTGGVGAYAAEMVCRAGVGHITIVDGDTVAESNINRQLVALHSTIGCPKTEILATRLRDINPDLDLHAYFRYLTAEEMPAFLSATRYDFVIDAIDTLAPKIELISQTVQAGIPVISSMGAGGRKDPTKLEYADISKTYQCALAKAVRKELTKKGIYKGIPVVFSKEPAERKAIIATDAERNKKSTVGTISFLPAIFGCYLAAYVINKITEQP